jgi:hypothetical protein
VICERCGCVFCWDEADEGTLAGERKRFCSKGCRKAGSGPRRQPQRAARKSRAVTAGRDLAVAARADCPTPLKLAFSSKNSALGKAAGVTRVFSDKASQAYRCPCGSWHLTTRT